MKQVDRVFLSINTGPTPRDAVPVVATEDPAIVDAALLAVCRRLGRGLDDPDPDPPPGEEVRRGRV